MTSVAVIGLGSRGLSVLERIVTLARLAGPAAGPVRIEVIDPLCDGAGVHGTGQPDYLLLNSTCSQVSMFPDACTVGDEVDQPGPSLYEWVTGRGLRIGADGYTVGTEGRPIRPTDFLPRRVLGEYLGWFLTRVLQRAPEHVEVTLHRAEAVDLSAEPDGSLTVTLSDGATVTTGYAFLTTGYTANRDAPRPGLITEPYPLPERLAVVQPGQSVAISGFGLSAMDAMSCLTVGRGGRFVTEDGQLRYLPSGEEPELLFYSRSGLPCRARPLVVEFGPPYQALVFTGPRIDELRAVRGRSLDFETEVMPLVLTEMRIAYRLCQDPTLRPGLASAASSGTVEAILDELDRRLDPFDARATFDGSAGMLLDDSESYQKWLADYLSRDLAEGLLGFTGSPVKAGLDILRSLRDTFRYAVDFGGLTEASLDEFIGRTVPAVNRAVVGPQYERHVELLALMAAGVASVPFGPEPSAAWNGLQWTVSSTRLGAPYSREVDWLLAAQVPPPAVESSASPLLTSLYRKGFIRPHRPSSRYVLGVDVDPDQHPFDASGDIDRRLWLLGPLCEGATFYNNLVPSPNVYSRPIFDAHRCVKAMYSQHP
jgi:uncharacterized NAD(P)/FAD-binding protein YdhS